MLSPEVVAQFQRDGYAVVPAFLSLDACAALRAEAVRLLQHDLDLATHPRTTFSTTGEQQASDDYFLGSAGKVRYFFEEGAVDATATAEQRLRVPPALAVNKIGHALHALNATFRACTTSPEVQQAARALGLQQPCIPQSMYIFKQPGMGGEVVAHQDSTFLYTEPPSIVGFWIALEASTLDNGCLWFAPGSHRLGLHRRWVRRVEQGVVQMAYTAPARDLSDLHFVPLPCDAGTLVLIHGEVWHKSAANLSPASRHAYTFHVMETRHVAYPADNWLQPDPDMPFLPLW